jgi:release factor glutamine methyltransferase
LYTSFEEPADEALRNKFRALVKRRAEGVPVAYLVGHREFYSLDFRVTPDVLIPRPETELLVLTLLDRIKEYRAGERPIEVADVGTGSGIVAITTARHAPGVRVTAIDTSPRALAVARENAVRLQVADRVEFIESDLFAAVGAEKRFDFVASNPPYVASGEFASLAREVREHEPRAALVAGDSGTSVIEPLVSQAGQRLKSGGWLLLEISPMLEERVQGLVARDGRFEPAAIIKDPAGLPRVVQARRK